MSSPSGNLIYEVGVDQDVRNKFLVIEKWDILEFHQELVNNFLKVEMLKVIEHFSSTPKGKYYDLSVK